MCGGALFCAFAGIGSLGACGAPADIKLCGQIPPDGCPLGRGGTCDDPLCAALYDCVDGVWTRKEICAFGGAGGAGGGGGFGAGGCPLIVIDHTGEADGCTPDLQSPDCPASAAEVCASSACLTDCVDFFLCTQGGWIDVAHCDPDGNLMIVPH